MPRLLEATMPARHHPLASRLALAPTRSLATLLVGLMMAFGAGVALADEEVTDERGWLIEDERNTIDVVNEFGASVVAIRVEVLGRAVDPFAGQPPQFRDFFGQPETPLEPRPRRGSGSGFVIEGGHVITNYHVVQEALEAGGVDLRDGASITVRFPGSEDELPARVVGAIPDYDIALLDVGDVNDLPEVTPIALSDMPVQVGQKVIAIGNPFGLRSTVTTGIVSAIGRDLETIGRIQIPMIQTDAAINPGNSGGPLLDSRGRLLGINTAIISGGGTRGSVGIGFAVPGTLLAESLAGLEEGGLIGIFAASLDPERPRIGVVITPVSDYPPSVREALGMPATGLIVRDVREGAPAADAGIRGPTYEAMIGGQGYPAGGDVIVQAEGEDLNRAEDLQRIVFGLEAGDEIELEVWRNGETRSVTVELRTIEPQQADD
ncbi:trypsin-like peptidase domain-containing protein [soil metagenome]